jgi:hypothetical protein
MSELTAARLNAVLARVGAEERVVDGEPLGPALDMVFDALLARQERLEARLGAPGWCACGMHHG